MEQDRFENLRNIYPIRVEHTKLFDFQISKKD